MSYSCQELEAYLVRHKITGPAADYIRLASVDLARDMGSGGYPSVVTQYQSKKMGVTIHTESRTAECIYAILLDADPSVEAFFEQPPAVDCERQTKAGYVRTYSYVPDMLVLGSKGPFVAQIKTEKELRARVDRSKDWVLQSDGAYQDLAAERALKALGLTHVVISTDQLSKIRADNINLLFQSLRHTPEDTGLAARARKFLSGCEFSSLHELAEHVKSKDLSPLIRLVATHVIHTDLSRFSLAEPKACFVTLKPTLLKDDVYGAWEELRRTPQGSPEASASSEILPVARHLARGVRVVELLAAGLSNRTSRRWRAVITEGAKKGISPVVAATPRYHKSGNRERKRPVEVLAFAEHVIRSRWSSQDMPSPAALWRHYKFEADRWHPDYLHVSRPTFAKIFANVRDLLAQERGGRRAANAVANPTNVEDRALKAARAFEMASCDHYLCDLECEVLKANNTTYVMRPWLTVLRDCYTKSVLAFWISLRPPSRRNCALIIRQCLRLHGRLPESLIVDRGAEFTSVYFSALMSHCGINLMLRPSAHPRYGSEAERFFGQFKDLWLAMRPGNRVSLKEVRSVSGSRRPKMLACLSLFDLWEDLETFSRWFDQYAPPSSMASPAALAAESLEKFSCSGRVIPYDDTFLIATAVDDKNYAIDHARGLHIGDHHFWHPALVRSSERSIPVRRDPQDPYRVYALVEGTWVTCATSSAVRNDLKHPLNQMVTGVIALDGADLRRVVREDADYRLMEAIEGRGPDLSRTGVTTGDTCRHPKFEIEKNAANDVDLFADVAKRELDLLEVTRW